MSDGMHVRDPLEGDRQIAQVIGATHTCFDDAMDILSAMRIDTHVPPQELVLVHGICLCDDKARFAHAWVERAGHCLFLGWYQGERVLCSVERPAYYRRLRVQERTKYTVAQAVRENQHTGTYGPWKPRYLALVTQTRQTWEGQG